RRPAEGHGPSPRLPDRDRRPDGADDRLRRVPGGAPGPRRERRARRDRRARARAGANAGLSRTMTSGVPRASLRENLRFTLTYQLPTMLRGALLPIPFWTDAAIRFDNGRGVATVERLTKRYAGRPVMLRGLNGQTLLVLAADDVRRVLESPV